ncbi:zingipain-2-like [Syzygium oleosum]|uniref:zingipain-2-like n=1 Tax=Syzygium oleosum TaxID=219896 RepID=UPI0024BA40F8|nr:zingipain-2-like [Syzygium oleosum]
MAFTLKSEVIIFLALILGAWAWLAVSVRMLREPTVSEQHEEWMTEYVRTYEDPKEKAKRQAIFAENMLFIADFKKSGKQTFELGFNRFSDLTNEEFVRSHTGYLAPKRPEHAEMMLFRHQNLAGGIPDSIDWVQKGVVNQDKYQGQCRSCWAFSVVAAVEGIVGITSGKLPALSEQQLIDCDTTSYGCRGGSPDNAFKYIVQNQGIASQGTYAYYDMDGTCNSTKAAERAAQIKGFADVPPGEEELMKAVAQQPVTVVIAASGREFQSYKCGVFNGDCGSQLDHAVVVVGYGTSEDGTDFWKIRNLWGEASGDIFFI